MLQWVLVMHVMVLHCIKALVAVVQAMERTHQQIRYMWDEWAHLVS